MVMMWFMVLSFSLKRGCHTKWWQSPAF